jgi:ankyrin repeat protein
LRSQLTEEKRIESPIQSQLRIYLFLHLVGANPCICCDDDYTPLSIAAAKLHVDIIEKMISKQPKCILNDNRNYERYLSSHENMERPYNVPPIISAVSNNNYQLTKTLYKAGASCNVRDKVGNTLTHLAYGNLRILQLLLTTPGLDLNATNYASKTAVLLAAEYNHFDCMIFLLQNGASRKSIYICIVEIVLEKRWQYGSS